MDIQSGWVARNFRTACQCKHHSLGKLQRPIQAVRDDAHPRLRTYFEKSSWPRIRCRSWQNRLVHGREQCAAIRSAARVHLCHVDPETHCKQQDFPVDRCRPRHRCDDWQLPILNAETTRVPTFAAPGCQFPTRSRTAVRARGPGARVQLCRTR